MALLSPGNAARASRQDSRGVIGYFTSGFPRLFKSAQWYFLRLRFLTAYFRR